MRHDAVITYLFTIYKKLFWLAGFLFFFCAGKGQPLVFNHLSVENGLSHNAVLAIAQDSRGFMWYGTAIGLNRYDGHRFKVYKNIREDSSSISNNYILSLLSDSEHTLWVGTSGGLNKYNPLKDAFERINFTSQANTIFCLYEDKQKNLWVGTDNGLFLLRGREKNTAQQLSVPSFLSGSTVRCFYEDHNGYLWAGTTKGLVKLSVTNDGYQYHLFRHEVGNAGSISADFITSITEDTYHRLWVGTQNGGLNRFDAGNNTFAHFLHNEANPLGLTSNNIRKIICDKNGKLWIGTQEGVNIIDPVTQKIQSYRYNAAHKKSLSQNSIYSLFQDACGTVWVGTYFGGVNSVYPYTTSFTVLQNNSGSSINNNVISSMVEDEQHNLWMGSEGGGLNYWNRTTGSFRAYTNKTNDASSLSSNFVKVVYKDKEGNIWAGTHSGGLNVWDVTHHRFHRFLYKENDAATLSSEVVALLEDSMGRFWVGNNAGLKIFRRNNTTLEPWPVSEWNSQIANTYTRALLEDSKKQIWIGTADGLYMLSNNILKKISDDYINCLTDDTKGTIWAGLHYGGLSCYDTHRQQLRYYTEKDGLSNNNVMGILEDKEHNLWLSTDNGLIKFNPVQKTFRTYTVSDGLADNAFNYNSFFKDSRGQFFFGGYNGLTYFFPGQIEVNHYAAPIVFTGLKLFNQPVPANEKNKLLPQDISTLSQLSFPYDKDVFTIEFALLNYIKSNKNKYAYCLEGFDKSWTETTMPSATYTNLPSGSYTFLIKGANNDGLWSKPVALRIQILPPFWRTWWAYCLYAIALSAIAFLLLRFLFLQALLKKEGELHQVKLNFFTNISHEIRTHLTLIMAPVEKILETKTPDDSGYQQLTSIKNNAGRLITLVNELMDFRKAETEHLQLHIAPHDLISFLQNIYTSFRDVSLTKQIRLSFVHDADTLPLYFDKGQMEKVFFNLLSNALKFTPARGQICVHVAQKANMVTISVTDDGRGIAPEHLNKLFTNFFQVADYGQQNTGYGIGLALSKKLVELHGGTITVESVPANLDKAGCTCFTVTLLQGYKHFEDGTHILRTTDEQALIPEEDKNAALHTQETVLVTPPYNENGDKSYTILIIEDNAELRSLLSANFQSAYQVLEAANGKEGWQTAVGHLPDIIISDVMMPEMDGFTFCAQLKTDERTSHIPVILLTAKSAQTDLTQGLETGADVYITKPFSTKIVALQVRNLLAARERMRQKFGQQIIEEKNAPDSISVPTVNEVVVNTTDAGFIQKVIQLVEEHMDNPAFGVDMLAKKVAMSQPVLYKKLKAVTNMSVNDFVKTLRLKKAAQLLKQKQFTVYEVAYAVGYQDRKYFSREFKKQFGQTPSEYAGLEEIKRI